MLDSYLCLVTTSCGDAMTELKEGAFDGEEEKSASGVNAGFDEEMGRERQERDVVRGAESAHQMDDELVAQVNAISDAGQERRAGHFDSPERQTRTHGAKEKRSHPESDQRKLPDASGDGQDFAIAEVKAINDRGETREPEPARRIHELIPPARPKFFDRREHDSEEERIESRPGGIVNPHLESAE